MNDAPERETVIKLLEKLGSEQDEDVLAAARTLHAQITDAGMNWQDLLVGDENAAPDEPEIEDEIEDVTDAEDDVEDDDVEDYDVEDDAPEPSPEFSADESETSALIDKLLAREGNSEEFREELEEYKIDLANGDFEASDHRYVQALYARLSKKR